MKMVSATGSAFGESAPRTSICAKIGAMLTGAPKIAAGPGRNMAYERHKRGDDDSDQNRARNFAYYQRGNQQKSEDGHQYRSRRQRARLHRRAHNSKHNNAGLVQSDEGEKKSDAHRKAVAQRGRNGFHQPLPQPQHGQQNERHTGDKDRAQRGLPANCPAQGRR